MKTIDKKRLFLVLIYLIVYISCALIFNIAILEKIVCSINVLTATILLVSNKFYYWLNPDSSKIERIILIIAFYLPITSFFY